MLLTAIIMVSGVLSAFLVNDTICLVLTPLVLDLVMQLQRNPMPIQPFSANFFTRS